jgi:transcription elongation factor S-II
VLVILAHLDSNSSLSSPAVSQQVIERNVTTDGVTIRNLGDKVRMKCAELIYAALATGVETGEGLLTQESRIVLKKAENVEKYVYDQFRAVNAQYKSRIRMLVSNLKDKGNPDLKKNVLSGKLDAEEFSKMTAEVP